MEIITLNLSTAMSTSATLTGYIQTPSEEIPGKTQRPAILIAPGGGYTMVSDREAEPVALAYASRGYQAFVLRYSVLPALWPAPLLEVAEAVHQIRAHAADWYLAPDQVVMLGFSAGGHLAAALSTLAAAPFLADQGYQAADIRPNALLLGYAVVSLKATVTSKSRSAGRLAAGLQNPEMAQLPLLKEAAELPQQVTAATPPTFLWATATDETVPVKNSLVFAEALAAAHVPFALHVFPQGEHGLSLANSLTEGQQGHTVEPTVTPWLGLSAQWLQLTFPGAGIVV